MGSKLAIISLLAAFVVGSTVVVLLRRGSWSGELNAAAVPVRTYPPVDFVDLELEGFEKQVRDLIESRDFAGLDDLSRKVADDKSRFRGGVWRTFDLDGVVASPGKNRETENGWKEHISFLKSWAEASPKSIFARCARANAEVGLAFYYRGGEFADRVPASEWARFNEHIGYAKDALAAAEALPGRYVGYHMAKLAVAGVDGAEWPEYDKLYNDAVAFEPTYEYFYKLKAHQLMPRWSGRPGDTEAYADSVKTALGGDEGVKMYSVLIGELGRVNSLAYMRQKSIAWDDVVRGYDLREAQYGTSRLRLNEFAKLALGRQDSARMCEAFRRLDGPPETAFDPSVWNHAAEFAANRDYAVQIGCKSAGQGS